MQVQPAPTALAKVRPGGTGSLIEIQLPGVNGIPALVTVSVKVNVHVNVLGSNLTSPAVFLIARSILGPEGGGGPPGGGVVVGPLT